ncbi:MAG: fibronectin type III domain-containing protein [Clostridia bacterium]|nr:fibronectin type III domain-containing protein [Clostridia bacterium]
MFKKTLSLILAIAMLCTLVPFAAIAEEATAELNSTSEELSATLAASTAKTNFNTSALSSIIAGTTVKLPATIANYNFSSDDFKTFTADQTAVNEIKNSNTYVLIDSLSTSNFTAGENSGDIARQTDNPWVAGLDTLKSNSGAKQGVRTAQIYVPEEKEYQIMYQRFGYVGAATKDGSTSGSNRLNTPGLTDWSVGDNTKHYFRMSIDGNPVSYTNGISGTSYETMGLLYKGKALHDAGLIDATNAVDWYTCSWLEWGPTFTLTEGYHTIEVYLSIGSGVPGVILTDKVAFDWSKIFPIIAYGVKANDANFLAANRASMTALQRVDTTAPALSGNVVQLSEGTETTATITLPGINETRAFYYVEFLDETVGIEPAIYPSTQTEITFTGLEEQHTYQVKVTPIDYLSQKGTAQTLSVMTKYPNVPFFSDGVISNATAVNDQNADTKIDVSWTAAQYYGQGAYAYNVYLDGEKVADNVAVNSYSFTGLTAGTEYDIKVVTTMDGVECEEDICILENSFYTVKTPTATFVSATDTTATFKVTGAFSPASDYEFSNSVVTADGALVTSSITDDVITVTGLTPAKKYNLAVSFNENKKGEAATRTNNVSVDVITMNSLPTAPAPEAIYPAYLEEKGIFVQHQFTNAGDQQSQAQKDAVAAAKAQKKWAAFTTDGGNTSSLWFKAKYWYGSNNDTVEVPLYFPATGDYYVFVHGSDNGDASRGINVSVAGETVKKGGNVFLFGTTGVSYCDEAVNVTAGEKIVTLTQVNGYRLDMVTFVSKDEVFPDGVPETQEDIAAGFGSFIALNFSSAEAFEKYATRHKVEKVFLDDGTGLHVEEVSPKVLEVTIFPTSYVNELENVEFELYLNNKLVATFDSSVTTYTINTGVVDGKNTITVKAKVGEAVNSSDSVEYELGAITATASVPTDSNGIITPNAPASISVQAPPFMTGTKTVNVLVVEYKNNRMTKIIPVTSRTVSAGQNPPDVTFTVTGAEPAKLIDADATNDPTVRSVKLYVLDENFLPIELTY